MENTVTSRNSIEVEYKCNFKRISLFLVGFLKRNLRF